MSTEPKTVEAKDLQVGDYVFLVGSAVEIMYVKLSSSGEDVYFSWRYRKKGSDQVGDLTHSGIRKSDDLFVLQEGEAGEGPVKSLGRTLWNDVVAPVCGFGKP